MNKNLVLLTNCAFSNRKNYRASICSINELKVPQLTLNTEQKDQNPNKLSLNYSNIHLAITNSPVLKSKEYGSNLCKPGFSKSPTASPRSINVNGLSKGSLPSKEKLPISNKYLSPFCYAKEISQYKNKNSASVSCFSNTNINCPENEQKKSKSSLFKNEDSETGKKIVEYLDNSISLLNSQIFAYLSINEKTIAEISPKIEKMSNDIYLFRENVQMKNWVEENKIKNSQPQISNREYQSTVDNLKNIAAESERRFKVYQRSFDISKKVFLEISEQLVNIPTFKQDKIIPTVIPKMDYDDYSGDDIEETNAFAEETESKKDVQNKESVVTSNSVQRINQLKMTLKQTLKQEITELDEMVNENAIIYIPNSQIKNVRKPTNSSRVISGVYNNTEENVE